MGWTRKRGKARQFTLFGFDCWLVNGRRRQRWPNPGADNGTPRALTQPAIMQVRNSLHPLYAADAATRGSVRANATCRRTQCHSFTQESLRRPCGGFGWFRVATQLPRSFYECEFCRALSDPTLCPHQKKCRE